MLSGFIGGAGEIPLQQSAAAADILGNRVFQLRIVSAEQLPRKPDTGLVRHCQLLRCQRKVRDGGQRRDRRQRIHGSHKRDGVIQGLSHDHRRFRGVVNIGLHLIADVIAVKALRDLRALPVSAKLLRKRRHGADIR